ncbi:MAG: DUF1559 domain-containing protein [Pirellulales bacterium]|nr:DUF1559 domain-containing protein [Pirellulales bacterium]
MNTPIRMFVLLGTLAAAGVCAAEEPFDTDARAQRIAPFLDEQTILVGRVDLKRIEVEPTVEQLARFVPELQGYIAPSVAKAKQVHDWLRKAGVEEIYYVVSLADMPGPPLVVAPLGPKADIEMLRAEIPDLRPSAKRRNDDGIQARQISAAVVFGKPRAFRRLEVHQPHRRPHLADAFRAAGDTDAQLLFLPTDNDRRVIRELMPQLRPELGGGPSTILTEGLLWAAVGASLAPEPVARLTIQSKDADAAERLARTWNTGLENAKKHLVKLFGPSFAETAANVLRPQVEKDRLRLTLAKKGGVELLVDVARPLLRGTVLTEWRKRSVEKMRQIGIAMHNYVDSHKTFPAQANYDKNGKPLLSWRVHLLPYMEGQKLYKQFRLDEPWDSPHNRKLIEKMPDIYRSPASKAGKGHTVFLRPVGPQTACPGKEPVRIRDITDGTSNTILLVEANDEQAVIWTKPEDLPFDPKNPTRGLGSLVPDGFNSLFADASARFIRVPNSPGRLRAVMTRNGREPYEPLD